MGLSNYLPSSRLIQPGVCTSTSRPASPFEGQCIFETDTDRLLVWNGSAWVIPNAPAQNPTGLELITPTSIAGSGVSLSGAVVSFSSATSVSVNGCFSSTYTNYRAVYTITTTSASGQFLIRLRANNNNSNDSYSSVGPYFYLSAGTGYTSVVANQAQTFAGPVNGSVGSSSVGGGFMEFFMPNVNTATTIDFKGGTNITNTGNEFYSGSIFHYTNYQADGFSFFSSGSSFNFSGNLRIYGYRNS